MKEFLAGKNKDLEKRLHESDSEILKSREEIMVNRIDLNFSLI